MRLKTILVSLGLFLGLGGSFTAFVSGRRYERWIEMKSPTVRSFFGAHRWGPFLSFSVLSFSLEFGILELGSEVLWRVVCVIFDASCARRLLVKRSRG